MDFLILEVLGKDNPSVECWDGDDCFQAEETAVDQLQAKLPTSVLPADIRVLSPFFLSDIKIGTHTLAIDTMCMSPTE
jgi:hypothetical protein